jgi:hypothetical protein
MARTTRRVYSKRRKRSPAKLSMMFGQTHNRFENTGVAGPTQTNQGPMSGAYNSQADYQEAKRSQESQLLGRTGGRTGGLAGLFAKSKHPPYLGGKETGGSGVGGGKTYTITEA